MLLVNVGARLLKHGNRRDGVAFLERGQSMAQSLGAVGDRVQARAASLLASSRPVSRERATATRSAERAPASGRLSGARSAGNGNRTPPVEPVSSESSQFMR
jgi:hypothetical protein